MTLPSPVLAALRFWDTTSTPQVTWNVTGVTTGLPSTVAGGDRSAVITALDLLYAGSGTFRTMLDNYIDPLGDNELIRIGSSTTIDVGMSKRGGGIDEYVVFDWSDIPLLHYFTEDGKLVQERIELTIAHELIHNIDNIGDTAAANEATMNGAAYDFMGDVLRKQRDVSYDLEAQVQISYDAWMYSGTTIFGEFDTDFSYSMGNTIEIARLGTTGADTLDHSNRTDDSVDLLFGRGGVDVLRGGGGGDFLWGGTGNDELYGGDGDDILSGDDGSDLHDGGDGMDIVSYEFAQQAVTVSGGTPGGGGAGDTFVDIEGIIGSSYSDTISLTGQTGPGVIEGRAGNDSLTGGGDADYLFGEGGNDTIHGGTGADTMGGGDDDDTINGNDGDDVMQGGAGDDEMDGGEGIDTLWGDDDDDTLDGGEDMDYLIGGDGDDILIVNKDHWYLDGGDGDDSYYFTSTDAVTLDWNLEYTIESDVDGSIKYNGSLIGAGAVLAEPQIGLGADYIDSTGTTYAGGETGLWIWLPTNEAIFMTGWSNGEMGIYLPGM